MKPGGATLVHGKPFPAKMSDDELGAFVADRAALIAVYCEALKPFYLDLRSRFAKKPKKATIHKCRTWDEYCRKVLDRTKRAVNYFLAGGNPVAKRALPYTRVSVRVEEDPQKETQVVVGYVEPVAKKETPILIQAALDVAGRDGSLSINESADKYGVTPEEIRNTLSLGPTYAIARQRELETRVVERDPTPAALAVCDGQVSVSEEMSPVEKPEESETAVSVTMEKPKARYRPPQDVAEKVSRGINVEITLGQRYVDPREYDAFFTLVADKLELFAKKLRPAKKSDELQKNIQSVGVQVGV